MQDRLQIILETIQQIVEFKEEPKATPTTAAARKRQEKRGRRRFTKPPDPQKKPTATKAALLAAIESGDKQAILAAVRKLRTDLEHD